MKRNIVPNFHIDLLDVDMLETEIDQVEELVSLAFSIVQTTDDFDQDFVAVFLQKALFN